MANNLKLLAPFGPAYAGGFDEDGVLVNLFGVRSVELTLDTDIKELFAGRFKAPVAAHCFKETPKVSMKIGLMDPGLITHVFGGTLTASGQIDHKVDSGVVVAGALAPTETTGKPDSVHVIMQNAITGAWSMLETPAAVPGAPTVDEYEIVWATPELTTHIDNNDNTLWLYYLYTGVGANSLAVSSLHVPKMMHVIFFGHTHDFLAGTDQHGLGIEIPRLQLHPFPIPIPEDNFTEFTAEGTVLTDPSGNVFTLYGV